MPKVGTLHAVVVVGNHKGSQKLKKIKFKKIFFTDFGVSFLATLGLFEPMPVILCPSKGRGQIRLLSKRFGVFLCYRDSSPPTFSLPSHVSALECSWTSPSCFHQHLNETGTASWSFCCACHTSGNLCQWPRSTWQWPNFCTSAMCLALSGLCWSVDLLMIITVTHWPEILVRRPKLCVFCFQEQDETALHLAVRSVDRTSLHIVDFLVQNRWVAAAVLKDCLFFFSSCKLRKAGKKVL